MSVDGEGRRLGSRGRVTGRGGPSGFDVLMPGDGAGRHLGARHLEAGGRGWGAFGCDASMPGWVPRGKIPLRLVNRAGGTLGATPRVPGGWLGTRCFEASFPEAGQRWRRGRKTFGYMF
ncbi:hypothetical protein KY290_000852 [Solanum tuberosum]|uniref:Uncharacterized protein n=1 Tax=Solanum tuberosum TaxID=4113 RepID=A0ABQ7WKI4_SOLTU|nr:hypothetical protein KY289_000910 [Solanum tuberosum]KAH0781254.1 hypothetical protein KY290_000852 [Solanum tuberosum]